MSPMPPGYNQPVGQPSYDGAEWGRKTSTTEGLGKGTLQKDWGIHYRRVGEGDTSEGLGNPLQKGWGRGHFRRIEESTTEGLGKGTHGCHHPAPPLCRIAGKPTDERGQLEAT